MQPEIPDPPSQKLRNGLIAFLADGNLTGRVFLDLLVTNTFPMFVLRDAIWLKADGSAESLSHYHHLSIPADLRLHLSGADHLFFDVGTLWQVADNSSSCPYAHCFTMISPSHRLCRNLVGKNKVFNGAAIFSPLHDAEFASTTRLAIDFFIHRLPLNAQELSCLPYVFSNSRVATDRSGHIAGPYPFESLQRRGNPHGTLAFSMRMSYVEMEEDALPRFYTPLQVFQKREKVSRAAD